MQQEVFDTITSVCTSFLVLELGGPRISIEADQEIADRIILLEPR
ncbi:hypothetical protein PI125_g12022 [Phytophthora idaei]|nr:hypothetical protein PI125_g12022 [Phytophthora idaei]